LVVSAIVKSRLASSTRFPALQAFNAPVKEFARKFQLIKQFANTRQHKFFVSLTSNVVFRMQEIPRHSLPSADPEFGLDYASFGST